MLKKFYFKKLQWWTVTVPCLTKSCWWFQLWPSIFNVLLDWFGVKGLISSIPKVQQATLRDILWKAPALESANLYVKEKLDNRTILDTYFDFLKSGTFFWNAFSYFSVWILNLESRILNLESRSSNQIEFHKWRKSPKSG